MPFVWYDLIAMLVICVCMRCIDNQILSFDGITFRRVAVEEAGTAVIALRGQFRSSAPCDMFLHSCKIVCRDAPFEGAFGSVPTARHLWLSHGSAYNTIQTAF